MSAASALAWRLSYGGRHGAASKIHVEIKRGEEAIFGDGPYPHKLSEFVGQAKAKDQLMTAMLSAAKRDAPLPHVLLASGIAGIGKTALAKITAASLRVGYVEVGGTVTVKDIRPVLEAMQPRDVLFIDEIHRLVAGGQRNAEWLLQLLWDGNLVLPTGVVEVAPITVIGATTDAQKLRDTILDRFFVVPEIVPYTEAEAVEIAHVTAKRLSMTLPEGQYHRVAAAADYNPRLMGRLLTTCRDILVANPDHPDPVTLAMDWSGVTADGLTRIAQDYLMLLYGYGGTAGVGTLKAALNETEIGLTERSLIQRGMVAITGQGRELTKIGVERAEALLQDHKENQ